MLSYLSNLEPYWGPFRLFGYVSLRVIAATVTSLIVGFIVGPWLIRRFRQLNFGHGYVDDRTGALGATYFDKKHTPTMGGLIIFISAFVGAILWAEPNIWVRVSLFVYTVLTIPGWRDDYLKVVHKNRDGISSWEKIAWQSFATFGALAFLLLHHDSATAIREFYVPFLQRPVITAMPVVLLLILMYLWVVGFSNAINLTDGLDGLATGCTITVALVFGIMAYVAGDTRVSGTLNVGHIPKVAELAPVCGALVGACMSFLWFNSHPAEVFMGDTGSLALGGLIGVIAFMVHQPVTLIIVGGVFVVEALSVICQVGWFKYTRRRYGTGKRIFRMAPLHHHFQKLGWPETKVVLRFWIISLGFALAGLATIKLQ